MAHEPWSSSDTQEKAMDLLQCIEQSFGQVIPVPANFQPALPIEEKAAYSEYGILVGFTGDFYGRIVIQSSGSTISKLGEVMFGMPLEGDMLHSFAGELANMIAGNTCTALSGRGRKIDITPPTVLVGNTQMYGVEQGILVPVELAGAGELNIILTIQGAV